MNDTVTLTEAKARWNAHTRHVISDKARRAARRGKRWFDNAVPAIVLGASDAPEFMFGFRRNESGHVYAYDLAQTFRTRTLDTARPGCVG